MITFYCPGCDAEHKANSSFQGRRAKCVRCGATIKIPEATNEYAQMLRTADLPDGEQTNQEPTGEATEQTPEEVDTRSPYEVVEAEAGKSQKKKPWKLIAGGLLGLVVLGVGGFFLTKSSTPPPKKTTTPSAPQPEPPPPPPAPPPVEQEFVGPPEPPEDVLTVTADRLAFEMSENAEECNARYANRLVRVSGVCGSFQAGQVGFRPMFRGDETTVTAGMATLLPDMNIRQPAFAVGVAPIDAYDLTPPPFRPRAGRPMVVIGRYLPGPPAVLQNGRLLAVTAPADEKYLNKTIVITGRVSTIEQSEDSGKGGLVVFDAPDTLTKVRVVAQFRSSQNDIVAQIKRGQTVTLSGLCSGRTLFDVRLENCGLGSASNATSATIEALTADYETDILPQPAVRLTGTPTAVTADEMARVFFDDRDFAHRKYGRKYLEVTGKILNRDASTRTLTFETGTDTPVKITANFTPAKFEQIPPDEPVLGVQCVLVDPSKSGSVRLDCCQAFDPDDRDPNVPRLTPDYLPYKVGDTWETIRATYPNQFIEKPKPGVPPAPRPPAQPHEVRRLRYRVVKPGWVEVHVLNVGRTMAPRLKDLASSPTKWDKPLKVPEPLLQFRYREKDGFVEHGIFRQNSSNEGGLRNPLQDDDWLWERVLKLRTKVGRSWTSDPRGGYRSGEAAGSISIQSTWAELTRDGAGRSLIKIDSMTTNTREFGLERRLETATIYAQGIGEVGKVSSMVSARYETYVAWEEQRVTGLESPSGELKGSVGPTSRETAPKPRMKPAR